MGSEGLVGGDAEWWQASSCEFLHPKPGVGVRGPPPRLPVLPAAAQRAAQNPTLRSLPPPAHVFLAPAAQAWKMGGRPEGLVREPCDSLGALLGELLLSRFRQFLRPLGARCAVQPQPPSEALWGLPRGGRGRGSHQVQDDANVSCVWLAESWQPRLEDQSATVPIVQMRKLRPKAI